MKQGFLYHVAVMNWFNRYVRAAIVQYDGCHSLPESTQ
jgi:hypothetical protein